MSKKTKTESEIKEEEPASGVAEIVFSPTEEKAPPVPQNRIPPITIPRLKSLRFRLWIAFVVMTFITLVILWLYLFVYYSTIYVRDESKEMDRFGTEVVEEYRTDFGSGFTDEAFSAFNRYLEDFSIEKDINILIKTDGKTYSSTNNSGIMAAELKPDIQALFDRNVSEYGKNYVFGTNNENTISENLIIFGRVEIIDGETVMFCITSDVPTLSASRKALLFQLLIITIVCLIICVIVGFVGSNVLSKPIHDITLLMADSSHGNKNEKLPTDSGLAEINELAAAYNKTLEKAEENARFRRDLLANVSHDMKTPLTMIRAYAEMIRDLTGGNKEKSAKNASTIISEADRLTSLITEIIELSKMESGVYELHASYFSMTDLIKETVRHFDIMQVSKGYNIVVDADEGIFVSADAERIERVLYNLIGNAINYTGEDKSIIIRCKKNKSSARVEVIDTGSGLDEEEMKAVWIKYYRLVQDKRKVLGSGLGLTIVKNILDMHCSTYGVRSEKGKGSNFWFELPVVTEKELKKASKE